MHLANKDRRDNQFLPSQRQDCQRFDITTNLPMPALTPLKAIIFDMDGVLIDTEPLYTIAYNQVMAPWGVTLDVATKHEIMGRPPSVSIPHVIKKYGLTLSAEEFAARRKPIMDQLLQQVPAMPGAEALVRLLHAQGKPIAVATSTFADLYQQKTKDHAWFELFDVIVRGDDPEIKRPKPAPDIFLLAAKRLGIDITHCGVLEDSPAGLEAARLSGAAVFPVTHQNSVLELLEAEEQS
jgi:pseudouridine 5'-phosphatase